MDALSQIVSTLKPRHVRAVGLDASGTWSLSFGRFEGIKFNAVVTGGCWLMMEGLEAPLRISSGDCFLLTQGTPFRLASDLNTTPGDAEEVFRSLQNGESATLNEGGEFLLLGSRFVLEGDQASLLLGGLPPLLQIRSSEQDSTLAWALRRLPDELGDQRPGGSLAADHLAHLMLIEFLRRYIVDGTKTSSGWLRALSDDKISQALRLMHEQPSRRWTLVDLAARIGMSRTSFAVRFKEIVGQTPLEYLTKWRMVIASELLLSSKSSIAAVSTALGYESESAFGSAFKRVMGCSPRKYGRSRLLTGKVDQTNAELGEP